MKVRTLKEEPTGGLYEFSFDVGEKQVVSGGKVLYLSRAEVTVSDAGWSGRLWWADGWFTIIYHDGEAESISPKGFRSLMEEGLTYTEAARKVAPELAKRALLLHSFRQGGGFKGVMANKGDVMKGLQLALADAYIELEKAKRAIDGWKETPVSRWDDLVAEVIGRIRRAQAEINRVEAALDGGED